MQISKTFKFLLTVFLFLAGFAESALAVDDSKFPEITLQSEPSGALISIDGIAQKRVTPMTIRVKANTEIKISLTKKGYSTGFKILPNPEHNQKVLMRLQKLPSVGFVSIKVSNAGPDAILYINKEKSLSKLPATMLEVPGDTEVNVRVEDSVKKISAEKTLFIKTDETKDIDLTLAADKPTK